MTQQSKKLFEKKAQRSKQNRNLLSKQKFILAKHSNLWESVHFLWKNNWFAWFVHLISVFARCKKVNSICVWWMSIKIKSFSCFWQYRVYVWDLNSLTTRCENPLHIVVIEEFLCKKSTNCKSSVKRKSPSLAFSYRISIHSTHNFFFGLKICLLFFVHLGAQFKLCLFDYHAFEIKISISRHLLVKNPTKTPFFCDCSKISNRVSACNVF